MTTPPPIRHRHRSDAESEVEGMVEGERQGAGEGQGEAKGKGYDALMRGVILYGVHDTFRRICRHTDHCLECSDWCPWTLRKPRSRRLKLICTSD